MKIHTVRITILIIIFLSFEIPLFGKGVFNLISKKTNSDINYLTIKNINSLGHGCDSMIEYFKPVKGEYNVYIFIKEFEGISTREIDSITYASETFHDLIILKTNNQNLILDGFYYRLEWAEVPSQFMLFRTFCNNIKLTDSMLVKELDLLNEYEMYFYSEDYTGIYDTNEYGQRILKFLDNDILKL